MKFLANENYPVKSIYILREEGYDVRSIIKDSPGIDDRTVLNQATQEGRIVLTFDRDYGELIYRHKMPVPVGVVYFRFTPITPAEPAQQLLNLLAMKDITLERKFTIISRNKVRQRSLPSLL